jgi:DNA polymerase-3 subunit gamma/tau
MKRAKKKSDEPYIKPPDGVQLNKIIVPANASVAAVGKQNVVAVETDKDQGITVTRDLNKLKTISIAAFNLDKIKLPQKEEKEAEIDVSSLPKDDFSPEKLIIIWQKYAAKMQEAGKESLYVTLTRRHPEKIDQTSIGFIIDNKVQEQDIEKEKPVMMEFIRKELNNFHLQLHLAQTTDDDNKQILYTSRDKFKKLAEKNPHLLTLKQRFNLDLEF